MSFLFLVLWNVVYWIRIDSVLAVLILVALEKILFLR